MQLLGCSCFLLMFWLGGDSSFEMFVSCFQARKGLVLRRKQTLKT